MAGGEPRLGTASIYMGNIIAMAPAVCNQNPPDYMATVPTLLNQFRRHINHLMVRKEEAPTRDSRNRPSLPRPLASQHIAQHPDQNSSFQLCTRPVKSEL